VNRIQVCLSDVQCGPSFQLQLQRIFAVADRPQKQSTSIACTMVHKAKQVLSTLLLLSILCQSIPTRVNAPPSFFTSLWISSLILSQVTFTTAEETCSSADSTDGSCPSTDTPQAVIEEGTGNTSNEEGFLHVVPWEGDPADKPVWWSYSYGELFDYFNCAGILPGYATIFEEGDYIYKVENHTLDPLQIQNLTGMWDEMYTKYKSEVNLSPPGSSEKVIVVPAEIGDAGSDKGRGVFVTERVPKGTLVVNTDSDTIGIFKDGHTWRKFVATLPAYTACNVIEWSWIQDFPLEDENDIRNGLTIMTAWDESNLLNNADWEDSEEEPNVKCGTPPEGWPEIEEGEWGPCKFHYFAIKDLEVGEEILLAYGEFEDFGRDWPRIGMPVGDGLPEPMLPDEPPKPAPAPVEE
jgi:hypothetical protein